MFFSRLLSLMLCASLVACPSVCRARVCASEIQENPASVCCPHCQSEDRPTEQPAPARPASPCCEFCNCLCAGALVDNSGLELQLEHMLAIFAAIGDSGITSAAVAPAHGDRWQPDCCSDTHPSGRLLRLRIESLLI